jgi:hypothetical protein
MTITDQTQAMKRVRPTKTRCLSDYFPLLVLYTPRCLFYNFGVSHRSSCNEMSDWKENEGQSVIDRLLTITMITKTCIRL